MRLAFYPALLALLLAGCSATGPTYEAHQQHMEPLDPELARVYVFRESRFQGSASDALIYLEGEKVSECANGGYLFFDTPPGSIGISARTFASPGEHTIRKEVIAGQEYYYEVLVNQSYVKAGIVLRLVGVSTYVAANENVGGWIFKEIPESEAKSRLRDKVYSPDGD